MNLPGRWPCLEHVTYQKEREHASPTVRALLAQDRPGPALALLVAAQRAGHAAARGVPLDCLARVLQAFGQQHARAGPRPRTAAAVAGLVEQLTVRELEILQLVAAGAPNQAIAEQLVVTLDTVNKHITHILAKLGAANRTEAVARAAAQPDPLTCRPWPIPAAPWCLGLGLEIPPGVPPSGDAPWRHGDVPSLEEPGFEPLGPATARP